MKKNKYMSKDNKNSECNNLEIKENLYKDLLQIK